MGRREYSYSRDMTFHINRRGYGKDIPATDIDFVEYDNLEPVLIWEAKSDKSHWKQGRRTASMIVQWKIAQRANIKYRVIENSDNWSVIRSYKILGWDRMRPKVEQVGVYTLPEFIQALYKIRGREIPSWVNVPDELEPISFDAAPQLSLI